MIRRITPLALVVLSLTAAPVRSADEGPQPEAARLRDHVGVLASREYQGRSGAGGVKAARYVADQFRKLGLEPLFDGKFEQPIPSREGPEPMGRNVGALLRGDDPALRDEWVIVSAHFDHLGRRGEHFFPGADDNASGVAMMLETARSFVEAKAKPRRSVMFLGFDLEEIGLFGSRYFVEHSPVPLDRVKLFITADMIGRSLGGVGGDYVFVMGSENSPGVRPWIDDAAKGRPLSIGILGSDILVLNRSDYGPFRSRKVPYLFFSTGENPRYHTVEDTPETIDVPKLEAISRTILGVARRAAESDKVPEWSSAPDAPLAEAMTMRSVTRILLDHRDDLKIGATTALLMNNALKTLDGIAERGVVTPAERTGLVRVLRIVMIAVFGT